MRIGKTRFFQSMKYILPALVLLSVGVLAIIKNSSAATCSSGYYICYAATAGGQTVSRYNHSEPVSGEANGASDWYGGNGAYALADSGYTFVNWKDESGTVISTDPLLIPCAPQQSGCDSAAVSVQQGETYTAYFESEGGEPTAATETITLGAMVDSGALSGKTIDLTLSSFESSAPMPSDTQGVISSDTTSVSFGDITYSEEGTWRYRISLQVPSGVLVDTGNLEVKVIATLDTSNNTIVTEKTYYKNDSELTSVDDFYVHVSIDDPTPAEDSIVLPIGVESGALEGNEAITLTLEGSPAPSVTSKTADKDTTSVSFGEITFTETGSYRYHINIDNPYATARPDAQNLEVKIDATLDETNNTIVTRKTYYKNDDEVSESDFVLNVRLVEPTPAEAEPYFEDVIGSDDDISDFSATMTPRDNAPAPTKAQGEIEFGTSIDFGTITFTEPGEFYYDIEFKNGDETLRIQAYANVIFNRGQNALEIESADLLDEDGNPISDDELREMISDLLAKEQDPDDDPDEGSDDSDDSGESSDDSETPSAPNTRDTFGAAVYTMAGATIFALATAAVTIKNRR